MEFKDAVQMTRVNVSTSAIEDEAIDSINRGARRNTCKIASQIERRWFLYR